MLGDVARASTTYAAFADDVRPGDRVLLNDGAVSLRVIENDGVEVKLEVLSGGATGNQKGIHLPGGCVSAPSLTEKDRDDLKAGIAAGVDLIALSFVRRGEDIRFLRISWETSKFRWLQRSKVGGTGRDRRDSAGS